jgi:hypothetical protein
MKKNNGEIHNNSLSIINQSGKSSKFKSKEILDIKMNIERNLCSNQKKIDDLQIQFGELCRIGFLQDDMWEFPILNLQENEKICQTCHFVYANPPFIQEESLIKNQKTMSQVLIYNKKVLVEKFKDNSRIASLMFLIVIQKN